MAKFQLPTGRTKFKKRKDVSEPVGTFAVLGTGGLLEEAQESHVKAAKQGAAQAEGRRRAAAAYQALLITKNIGIEIRKLFLLMLVPRITASRVPILVLTAQVLCTLQRSLQLVNGGKASWRQ
ncbi:hypothetical protein KP509_16G066000 [Ceratopteris richardii]|uniref:Uncharacterized protein n=1 Tax=Ceratopteris richardii TaxID=49495 RepID=A0A8T2T0C2_CERRI|nr:hypothetical protein KP509_16G066000 [Ceratopteris richardii]